MKNVKKTKIDNLKNDVSTTDVITKEKKVKKAAKAPLYTYIASKSHPKILNSFTDKNSEEKCLTFLKEIFLQNSKIEKIDLIPSNIEELKMFYKRHFPNSEEYSSFVMKTKLKKLFKQEYSNDKTNVNIWSYIILGFNAIMKKLEKGVSFDLIILDGILADAPIISHMRELAMKNKNSDLVIVSFEAGNLLNVVNSQYRQFGNILSLSFPKCDSEKPKPICQFIDLVKTKVEHFEIEINKNEINENEIKENEIVISQDLILTNIIDKPVKSALFSPYVVDENIVEELHLSNQILKEVVIKESVTEIDFMVGLKREKQTRNTSHLIKPPNQQKNKKAKKRKIQN